MRRLILLTILAFASGAALATAVRTDRGCGAYPVLPYVVAAVQLVAGVSWSGQCSSSLTERVDYTS